MRDIKIGDVVRLKRGAFISRPPYPKATNHRTATVVAEYRDIDGGVRVDRWLGGFVSWNVKDLELVRS